MAVGVLKRLAWLEQAVRRLQKRTTVGGGGVPPSGHSETHENGGTDPLDVTTLDGFTGDPADVLRGDGTFGPALGASGAGQWLQVPNVDGTMSLSSTGHPVLVWWGGP